MFIRKITCNATTLESLPAKSGNDDASIEKETKSCHGISASAGACVGTWIAELQEEDAEDATARAAANKTRDNILYFFLRKSAVQNPGNLL
jgi:hypothetical protein